jgi:hypothetical protein
LQIPFFVENTFITVKEENAQREKESRRFSLPDNMDDDITVTDDLLATSRKLSSRASSKSSSTADMNEQSPAFGGVGITRRSYTDPCPRSGQTGMAATANEHSEDIVTTLMIRNLPSRLTTEALMEHFDAIGYRGSYDYIYMPQDKKTTSNKGYVFVNFIYKMDPSEMENKLQEHSLSGKRLIVTAARFQGVLKNLEQMVSFGLDVPDGSFFNKPWVRVDGVVSPMAAPIAYERYRSMSE